MATMKSTTQTSYGNSSFEEQNSGGISPSSSRVFVVKPDDEHQQHSHSGPYRHEPVTRQNIGRTILHGIRCKLIFLLLF